MGVDRPLLITSRRAIALCVVFLAVGVASGYWGGLFGRSVSLAAGEDVYSLDVVADATTYLASEVESLGITEAVRTYRLTNRSSEHPLRCELRERSCGCLTIKADNTPFLAGTSVELAPGQSSDISLGIPMHTQGSSGTKSAKFQIASRGMLTKERIVSVGAVVHADLTVSQQYVQLVSGLETSPMVVEVSLTRRAPPPENSLTVSTSASDWLSTTITPSGEAKTLECGLLVQRYNLAIQLKKPARSSSAKIEIQFSDAPLNLQAIVVSVVDGRSLLCVDHLDFGVVKSGILARRAFVVRTADGSRLGRLSLDVHGGGLVILNPGKSLSEDRMLVAVSFQAIQVGTASGEIQLIPSGSDHEPKSIAYHAEVGP